MIRITLGIIILFAAAGGVENINSVSSLLCVLVAACVGVWLFLSGIEK